MTFKSIATALFLVLASTSASAALTTIQTHTFTGAAGTTGPVFTFNRFNDQFNPVDGSYRELTNVFFKTTFTVSNGLVGADNLTNQTVTGLAHLGANISSITNTEVFLDVNYMPMFTRQELIQYANFSLAADPTLSSGGTGPDVAVYHGVYDSLATQWKALNTNFLANYYSTLVNPTFDISYAVGSDIYVGFGGGVLGTFQSVNATFAIDMQYQYNLITPPPASLVSAPLGMGVAALSLFGLASARRKKNLRK